jgi:hypothetical protein
VGVSLQKEAGSKKSEAREEEEEAFIQIFRVRTEEAMGAGTKRENAVDSRTLKGHTRGGARGRA